MGNCTNITHPDELIVFNHRYETYKHILNPLKDTIHVFTNTDFTDF